MIERVCWCLLALIHAPPAAALFRADLLTRLYGIAPDDPGFLLLRHRAALFVVVLVACAWAAAAPAVRPLAAVAAAISMGSFLILYHQAGMPPTLRTIAIADWIGLAPLAYVAWRAWASPRR